MSPIFTWLRNVFAPPKLWYAVRDKQTRAWLVDPGGWGTPSPTFDVEFGRSMWFDDHDEAYLAILCAGLRAPDVQLVELCVQPNTNQYAMKEIPW